MATMQIALDDRSWAPLCDLGAQLLAEPGRARLAIAVMDVHTQPDHMVCPVAQVSIRHMAAISDPADRRIGRLLLRREHERLADRPVLPWELERDLSTVLQSMNIHEKGAAA